MSHGRIRFDLCTEELRYIFVLVYLIIIIKLVRIGIPQKALR